MSFLESAMCHRYFINFFDQTFFVTTHKSKLIYFEFPLPVYIAIASKDKTYLPSPVF